MGFLDRLLGREEPQRPQGYGAGTPAPNYGAQSAPSGRDADQIAVERYRYLLRTAPPETIEQVHEEAFAKLTPEQRRLLFTQLSENAPAGEQPLGDDPRSLAQSATRSEFRQPGTLERSFGGMGGGAGGGMGFGGMVASSLLGTVAGYVIGSALVSAFLPSPADLQAGDQSGADQGQNDQGQNDQGGDQSGGDAGGTDAGTSADGGGDWSGGSGDFTASGGGDWAGGSGDFGGGDFGGGDFGGGFDF
ncbi:hypothetical protein VD659_18340 [Herbiconiux sp. 11R-BC]|uniref:hypothetical protein n=1 Tax=Herbiconiux sp. 11R-BC TaxID=3111637 RepID=UPI003C0620D4